MSWLAGLVFVGVAAAQGQTPAKLYEKYAGSIVQVVAKLKDGSTSMGTGYFYMDSRTVVTCAHVIEGATDIKLNGTNGKTWEPFMISLSKDDDLAVMDILVGSDRQALSSKAFADVKVGEPVTVIGNPLGVLVNSLTTGVVSAKRKLKGVPLVQVSAATSEGSSGSPVLDSTGKLIGTVSFTYRDGQSLNMAVAREPLEAIIKSPFKGQLATALYSSNKTRVEPLNKITARPVLEFFDAIATLQETPHMDLRDQRRTVEEARELCTEVSRGNLHQAVGLPEEKAAELLDQMKTILEGFHRMTSYFEDGERGVERTGDDFGRSLIGKNKAWDDFFKFSRNNLSDEFWNSVAPPTMIIFLGPYIQSRDADHQGWRQPCTVDTAFPRSCVFGRNMITDMAGYDADMKGFDYSKKGSFEEIQKIENAHSEIKAGYTLFAIKTKPDGEWVEIPNWRVFREKTTGLPPKGGTYTITLLTGFGRSTAKEIEVAIR